MPKLNFSKKIINVKDYSHLTRIEENTVVWDDAFNAAYSDLPNGATLVIPEGTYHFHRRAELRNKRDITFICEGVLSPLPSQSTHPWIGLIMIHGVHNATFNSLTFDGISKEVPEPVALGKQSMIELYDATNITFNNLNVKNVAGCGFNANGKIDNLVFNTVKLKNIGEHGFYFGGTDTKNVSFYDLYCENIGLNNLHKTRSAAVIKFRNKQETDIMHDNIVIDGFEFTSNTNFNTYDRYLIQANETKNVVIKNGKIKGADTTIFSGNSCIDSITIDNVDFDGNRICYQINTVHAYDDVVVNGATQPAKPIITPGKMKNRIYNSKLKNSNTNACFTDICLYSNCEIIFGDKQFNNSMATNVNKEVRFENCKIGIGNGRFNISKDADLNLIFNKVLFSNSKYNDGQKVIQIPSNLDSSNYISLNEVNLPVFRGAFIAATDENMDVRVNNSQINTTKIIQKL